MKNENKNETTTTTLDNCSHLIQNNIQFVDSIEFWVSNGKSFIKSYLQPMNFDVIGTRFTNDRKRIQYLLLNNVKSRENLENSGFEIDNNSYIKCRENQFIKVTSSVSSQDFEFHSKRQTHGDFIQNISFYCKDINLAYKKSILGGAKSVQIPCIEYFNQGLDCTETAIIESPFKDLQHTFINRNISSMMMDDGTTSRNNPLLLYPEFNAINDFDQFSVDKQSLLFDDLTQFTGSLDHIATCIKHGEMDRFIVWYNNCLGFKLLSNHGDEDSNLENELILDKNFYVITKNDFKYTKKENIGLKMAVLSNQPSNTPYFKTPPIQFVISEAMAGGEGQIEQFIHYFGGEGVQHLAWNSNNIFNAVANAKSQKLEFVYIPNSYYEKLDKRLIHLFPNSIPKKLKDNLMKFKILIDSDSTINNNSGGSTNTDTDKNNNNEADENLQEINNNIGFIKQIFTKYITDAPTMFFELIERSNSPGFGKGNIIALFESLESESSKS